METKFDEVYEKSIYKLQLEESQEFQDYCARLILKEMGIPLTNYQTKKYQYSEGENAQGWEIKLDKLYVETGNLYIEMKEKSNPANPDYVKSGIYRLDNTWIFCVGDYDCVWLFAKTTLILLHKSGRYREVENKTSTSLFNVCVYIYSSAPFM